MAAHCVELEIRLTTNDRHEVVLRSSRINNGSPFFPRHDGDGLIKIDLMQFTEAKNSALAYQQCFRDLINQAPELASELKALQKQVAHPLHVRFNLSGIGEEVPSLWWEMLHLDHREVGATGPVIPSACDQHIVFSRMVRTGQKRGKGSSEFAILVAYALPIDDQAPNVDDIEAQYNSAVQLANTAKLGVPVRVLPLLRNPQFADLKQASSKADLLYLIAHGTPEGSVLLCDKHGKADPISASLLAATLGNTRLSAVIFANCYSGNPQLGKHDNATNSIGEQFVRYNTGMAISFHDDLESRRAKAFFQSFFENLFAKGDLGLAVGSARFQLHSLHPEENHWARPRLFTASCDTRLIRQPSKRKKSNLSNLFDALTPEE